MKKIAALFLMLVVTATFTGCAKKNVKPDIAKPAPPNSTSSCACPSTNNTTPIQIPDTKLPDSKPADSKPADVKVEPKIADYSLLRAAKWEDIDGFNQDDLTAAWPAWMQGCSTLNNKPAWQKACTAAIQLNSQTAGKPTDDEVTTYFKQYFTVYKATNLDGSETGTITGYYEPLLSGSRIKSAKYPNPLYAPPNDLITVELDSIYPELKYKRVRGRLVGNKLVPYYNRAEIETEASPIKGRELLYIDDIIDAFFLQIQGSGLVQLDNGEQVHVGYADQNGQTYNSIGRLLVERGELTLDKASMQGIKNWARNNIGKLRELLNNNPSYVFFRELPAGLPGPLGALGVPILGEHVVAVDPKFVPLGAPIFLSTTEPNSTKPLKRLMLAQDTGGAIKGGVRADFFWGAGNEAGAKAGAMKQTGKIWVLLPKEFVIKP